MNRTNMMGIRVMAITATVFGVLFALYWAGQALLMRQEGEEIDTVQIAERSRDTDGDGMADLYETEFYKTDPRNSDTDGDGMSDRDEIVAGRDPLIPGPDDESKPATGSRITKKDTFTAKYLASLPDDVAREGILDQVKLEAFVNSNKGILLPEVIVKTSAEEGKGAIGAYLDAVSSTHNDQLGEVTSSDIEASFRLIVNTGDVRLMQTIVDVLRKNIVVLNEVVAPNEAVGLHTKMVAATYALTLNSERLLFINKDFVGGLIAARNIEELGGVWQEMATEINELETKYGLE